MSTLTAQIALILCFVAGKSGGHLLPCITQAEKILQSEPTAELYLFSAGTPLDHKIMEKHREIHHIVPEQLDTIPYKKPWLFPLFLYNVSSYFIKTVTQLWHIKPTKIISFGGFNSIPVCLAGKLLGIPFELYELNVQPGQTTKFLSYFTDTIHICFSQTATYFDNKKCVLTQYPVRFTQQDRVYDKTKLLQAWSLSPTRKTILILGGSQGSVFINQIFKECLQSSPKLCQNIQIIHQIGIYDQDDYQKFYEKHNIPAVVFSYNEQLQNFYNLADLIVCRAGAGTLFEIEFFKKPCIVIPLETDLNNHQVQNAQAITAMHPEQFTCMLQKNCTQDFLPVLQEKIDTQS